MERPGTGRQLYLTYPQIVEAVPPQLEPYLLGPPPEPQDSSSIVESLTPRSRLDGQTLLSKLSFTHLVELMAISDDSKRAFYEVECLRGNWSVRELKRQVASLYYERSGLSTDKKRLSELARQGRKRRARRWRSAIPMFSSSWV